MKKDNTLKTELELPEITLLPEQQMHQIKGGCGSSGPRGSDKRKRPTGS